MDHQQTNGTQPLTGEAERQAMAARLLQFMEDPYFASMILSMLKSHDPVSAAKVAELIDRCMNTAGFSS